MPLPKFVREVVSDPQKIYRIPSDVLRDRRMKDPDRVQILESWKEKDPACPGLDEALAQARAQNNQTA